LEPVLKTFLSPTIQLINPAAHVVAAAMNELDALGLRNLQAVPPRAAGDHQFYVSGCPEQFAQLSQQWLGYIPQVETVCLQAVPAS
jgi:glutamate racemase